MAEATPDRYDLERFVEAQDSIYSSVLVELRDGRKTGHWMWFIFPQLRGLGHSPTAIHYGIAGRKEAAGYLAHPVLGPRLKECARLVNAVEGRTAHQIFGSPDDVKFRSSMTLFDHAAAGEPVFGEALRKYFGGEPDRLTLDRLWRILPGSYQRWRKNRNERTSAMGISQESGPAISQETNLSPESFCCRAARISVSL